jgi:hypothetical protein
VAHFDLIHVLSIGLGLLQGFSLSQMSTLFFFYPQGYRLNLPGVYAMWPTSSRCVSVLSLGGSGQGKTP